MKTYTINNIRKLVDGTWLCDIYLDNHNNQPSELFCTVYGVDKDDLRNKSIALTNLLKTVHQFENL